MRNQVEVVDYHTAGEPFRIVVGGVPSLLGTTALDKRSFAQRHLDDVRQLLTNEPRGHADMYGGFVTDSDDDSGDIGVVFFHKDGFSTACGHGVIALATWAVDSGRIDAANAGSKIVVDTPSGRLETTVEMSNGRVESVAFVNVPSYVSARYIPLQLSDDVVSVDIAYGGAYYAAVDASQLGLAITPKNLSRFVEIGREIRAILLTNEAVEHPTDHRLSGLYGTIFFEEVEHDEPGLHQRNVTVFADGEVDRSPCGSGTSARLALLDSTAQLGRGDPLIHESVIGTKFEGRVIGDAEVGGIHGVVTEVRGSAYRTGTATYSLEPDDPLGLGFQLR